jgi:hypothetical protein
LITESKAQNPDLQEEEMLAENYENQALNDEDVEEEDDSDLPLGTIIAVLMRKIIPARVVEKQVQGELRSRAKAKNMEEAPLAVVDVVEGILEEGCGKHCKFPNTHYKSFWHHNKLASDD